MNREVAFFRAFMRMNAGKTVISADQSHTRAPPHPPSPKTYRPPPAAPPTQRTPSRASGPIPLPTEKDLVTHQRSTHKYKDSREQFELRTHKRLIDILQPTPKTIDALTKLDLPAGVEIEIKL